jgi:hypothetical protein
MTRPLTGLLALVFLPLASLSSQSRQLTIPDNPACSRCRMVLERVATLGSSGEPAFSWATRVAVDSRGRFFVASTYDPGKIVMYDTRGVLTRTFGRPGSGPGEFGDLVHMLRVGPGDSVHVFEGNRESVLAPGIAAFGSQRILPVLPNDVLFLRNGRSVVQRAIMGEGRTALPLHLLDPGGRIARSFGGGEPFDPGRPYLGVLLLSAASGNRIWSAHFGAYRIDLWSLDGSRLRTLVRDANWFGPWDHEPYSLDRARRHPRIVGVAEDPQGRLWVNIKVPNPRWRPPADGKEMRLDETPDDGEFFTVLEVLDPRTGRLLARGRFAQNLIGFIGNGLTLFSRREDAAGNVVIDVWRVRLSTS